MRAPAFAWGSRPVSVSTRPATATRWSTVDVWPCAASQSAEDQFLDLFTDDEVKQALEDLPENFRLPVLLADVQGFSYKEIAEMLEIPIGTVTALADLPHDFRDVVVLVDLGEFSYAEAAQILDIPIGTVMSRLHRGRKAMQRALYDFAEARGLAVPVPESSDG